MRAAAGCYEHPTATTCHRKPEGFRDDQSPPSISANGSRPPATVWRDELRRPLMQAVGSNHSLRVSLRRDLFGHGYELTVDFVGGITQAPYLMCFISVSIYKQNGTQTGVPFH
jgi:hypothetical protein